MSFTTLAIWRAIGELSDELGYCPSYREISARAWLAPSNIPRHLDKLVVEGVIEWQPGQARSIRLCRRLDESEEIKRSASIAEGHKTKRRAQRAAGRGKQESGRG